MVQNVGVMIRDRRNLLIQTKNMAERRRGIRRIDLARVSLTICGVQFYKGSQQIVSDSLFVGP